MRSLLALSLAAWVEAVEVFVMLGLDTVTSSGELKDPQALKGQLQQLKGGNVDGVMADVWWGATEPSPKSYNFDAYKQLLELCKEVGLKAQLVTSFHQCGGNVGDTCNIPLPSFVTGEKDIWYKDQHGHEDKEYISLFADNVTIAGRTPLQMYKDWFDALAQLDMSSVAEIQVGMGPAGELRYPAYQLSQWQFCGVGAFQCYDAHALRSLAAAGQAAGHPEWTKPPSDAGDYNSRPNDAAFFQEGYKSDFGRFFLKWYSSQLLQHGAAVLQLAKSSFESSKVRLAGKVAGIHWWYKAPHHAAELTSGYYNADGQDAYGAIASVFQATGAGVDFTCMEMADTEQSADCASGPEELVKQVMSSTSSHSIALGGENALPRYDDTAYGKIESYKSGMEVFTYLRLGSDLLNGDNWSRFQNFVNQMHQGLSVVAWILQSGGVAALRAGVAQRPQLLENGVWTVCAMRTAWLGSGSGPFCGLREHPGGSRLSQVSSSEHTCSVPLPGMETETATVAVSPEPLLPLALPGEHMDRLQRLDANMAQTSDWQHLRAILADSTPFVRNTICNALQDETARSFQNVAGQFQALQNLKSELLQTLQSEDAAALHHLMRDIHPSDTHALQREADGIDQDVRALRLALENEDRQSLKSRAVRVKNKAKRFRDKCAELPELDRLQRKLEDLCRESADGAARSDTLMAETRLRHGWWVWLLMEVQCLVARAGCVLTVAAGAVAFGPVASVAAQRSTNSHALAAAYSALSMAKTFAASKSAEAAAAATVAAQAAAQSTAAAAAAKAAATSAAAVQASGSGVAGAAVAATTGATAAAATTVAGVGAPAATFMGSEMLGGVAVSLGLLPTPAAPVGIVLGVGAAASAAAVVLWHCMQPAAAAEISATAAQLAADASAAAAAAEQAQHFAFTAVAASSGAADSVTNAAGTVASLTSATSLHSIFASLSTGLMSTCFAPLITCAGLFLALALLGYVGCDLVKRLLAELFAAEIQQHERAKDEFQRMAQVVDEAAKKLKTVYIKELNEALYQSLDSVVAVAQTIAADAEDAQALLPESEEMNAEMLSLKEQVDELCSLYERVPEAISELVVSLRELEPAARQLVDECPRSFEPPTRIPIAVPARATEDTLALINPASPRADEDWIFIESPPVVTLAGPVSPPPTDSVPSNTYFLVPVEMVERLGAIYAAGPNGNRLMGVQRRAQALRLMARFSVGGEEHRFTANHQLRVRRSGSWIQEQASNLRVGDIITTSNGLEPVESSPTSRVNVEEVYRLEIQDARHTPEVYVFTPSQNGDGQLHWGGVAVLSSLEDPEHHEAVRSSSAPPRLRDLDGLPSQGSRHCRGPARCTNVCRRFRRGSCAEGRDCRFCHLAHPEEPRRAARGARDGQSSQSSQSN
ncbi:unnamed protein product [Effrenium voratum]|uniref:Beta-amylase n=1 Tax=Effrenium voratum TaxID=2562239 RepID=A0AA36HVJ0_9DINO|nr:unnamed protein product [Effrenium voratum]